MGQVEPQLQRIERDFDMKLRIFQALYDLVMESPEAKLDDVKITELCRRAEISKPTFYNHFADKYAVVVWIFEALGANNFAQIGLTMEPYEALLASSRTVWKYRGFLAKCLASKYYGSVYTYLEKMLRKGLVYAAELHCEGPLPDRILFAIRFYAAAVESTAADWVSGATAYTPEEIVQCYVEVMPKALFELLEEPALDRGGIPFIDSTKPQNEPYSGLKQYSGSEDRLPSNPDGTRVRRRGE